jgi:hypothetical protein
MNKLIIKIKNIFSNKSKNWKRIQWLIKEGIVL